MATTGIFSSHLFWYHFHINIYHRPKKTHIQTNTNRVENQRHVQNCDVYFWFIFNNVYNKRIRQGRLQSKWFKCVCVWLVFVYFYFFKLKTSCLKILFFYNYQGMLIWQCKYLFFNECNFETRQRLLKSYLSVMWEKKHFGMNL